MIKCQFFLLRIDVDLARPPLPPLFDFFLSCRFWLRTDDGHYRPKDLWEPVVYREEPWGWGSGSRPAQNPEQQVNLKPDLLWKSTEREKKKRSYNFYGFSIKISENQIQKYLNKFVIININILRDRHILKKKILEDFCFRFR